MLNPQEVGKAKHKMSNIQHPITNVKVNPPKAGEVTHSIPEYGVRGQVN
jgi:hypothetical protein